jgi:hypothetical protein
MIRVVLATICFFACAFYLYVLSQWMKGKKRKTTSGSAVDNEAGTRPEEKRAQISGSGKPAEWQRRGRARAHSALSETRRLRVRDRGCDECERIAYERIATSFRVGHRS